MDKLDYIESILSFVRGITGINYQLQLKKIFITYYKYIGKTYEMPDFYGGDQKNDGWVVEDALFYQIYAPTRLKDSLKKEIQDKFETDLSGLLNIVYNDKKWNGDIKEFIFIVNTFDGNLPHDSERFFEKTVDKYKNEYKIDFKYRVTNGDYLRELLEQIEDVTILEKISSALHIRSFIDYNSITESVMMDLILQISGNLNKELLDGFNKKTNYNRISSPKKIEINDLEGKREEIENIICKLDVVENAVKLINQEVLCEDKFERVKEHVVMKYENLNKILHGVELYEKIISEMLMYINDEWNMDIAMRFLIVYIFDKCDIFEKEQVLS